MLLAVAAILSTTAIADEVAPTPPTQPNRMNRMRRSRPANFNQAAMGAGMNDPILRAIMNPKVVEELGLSDEQKEKLVALKSSRDDNHELQKKVGEQTRKQIELLQAEKIDEAAIMASIDEVFELRKKMAKAQTKRIIEARSILSPEQLKKARQMIEERRAKFNSEEFLSAVDEIDLDETALNSPAELLLAWQDIPYTTIADEQTAE